MATMAATDIKARSGAIRKALNRGEELLLTFHNKPWALVLPYQEATQLRTENARLTAEVEALRAKLAEHQEAAA